MKRKTWRLFTPLLALLFINSGEARPLQYDITANAGERNSVYVGAENFYWDEHYQGEKLLDESGYLYELGLQVDNFNQRRGGLLYQFRLGFIAGTVDYDGATQSGIPLTTETDYEEYYLEYQLGYRFPRSEDVSFDLLGGIGYDNWSRDINDGTTSLGTRAFGYTEQWNTTYLKALAGINLFSHDWANHIHIGLKYPFMTDETIDFLDASLEPKGQLSGTFEWGIDYLGGSKAPLYGMTLYHEVTTFDESDVDYGALIPVLQPDSERRVTGLRLHYFF